MDNREIIFCDFGGGGLGLLSGSLRGTGSLLDFWFSTHPIRVGTRVGLI